MAYLRPVGLMLFLSFFVQRTDALAAGSYYSSHGGTNGVCPIATCAQDCPAGEYRSGCSANSPGVCSKCTNTRGAGEYYSGTGGLLNDCPKTNCPPCSAGEKNTGCGTNDGKSQGTCGPCGTPGTTKYWITPTSATVQCVQGDHKVCNAGQLNTGYSTTSEGGCSNCPASPALLSSQYWVTPTTATYTVCTRANKLTCNAGYHNTDTSTTSAGACTDCPAPGTGTNRYYIANNGLTSQCVLTDCTEADCSIGQYKKDCGKIAPYTGPGACEACTTKTSIQMYATKGIFADLCQVQDCLHACPIGQYNAGCGTVPSNTNCQPCTGAIPDTSYYSTHGAYTANSCTVTTCSMCSNGKWLQGCGSTASGGTDQGTCQDCTNTS